MTRRGDGKRIGTHKIRSSVTNSSKQRETQRVTGRYRAALRLLND